MELFETQLPGVGVRYDFTTSGGDRVGVVVHRDGRREFLVYDEGDPDACRTTVWLSNEESAAMVELLGGSKVTEKIGDLRHEVEGLAIEWITLPASGGLTGRTIGDGAIRTRTGASVVAVIRGDVSIPGPGPDFTLGAGDVALVVGSVEGVRAATQLLAR